MKYVIFFVVFALAACDDASKKMEEVSQTSNENPLLGLQNDTVKKVETDIGVAAHKAQEALENIEKQ